MKILLLGKDGQVGVELQQSLQLAGNVIALGRKDADLEDPSCLTKVLYNYAPDVIVNAAAYTAVDKAEGDRSTAYQVNANAVDLLATYSSQNNVLLIHYSTDYVFDGTKLGAYVETDSTNPQSIYGSSKAAGEGAIKKSGCDALIFRTSWVFSVHGNNFVKNILHMAKEKESLNIIGDQYGSPTSAQLIAEITTIAIISYKANIIKKGIYHLTASGETSWHGLACRIVAQALKNNTYLALKPEQIHLITTEEYPLPAKRPKNSRMNNQALSKTLNLKLPDWKIHVDQVVNQLLQKDF